MSGCKLAGCPNCSGVCSEGKIDFSKLEEELGNFKEDENLADDKVMKQLGVSRRPYYKAKDELKEKGYIKIIQFGSTKYKWYVGKEAISKDDLKYQNKKRKDDELFAKLVLEGNSINNQDFKSKVHTPVISGQPADLHPDT